MPPITSAKVNKEQTMKLTPLDIKKQEFKKVMRGYDPVEVDTFMDMMANEFEEVLKQQKEMRDRSIELDTQLKDYRQIEKTLQQTLLQAQEVTGRTYESARKEAEIIVKDAEGRAARIVEQANSELIRINKELSELRIRRESLIGRMRVLLSAELDLLKTLDSGGVQQLTPDPSLGSGKQALDIDSIMKNINNDPTPQSH
ncbi:DivIVA domain-containing protein [bacterium]|nr:MAG: DivIVA domain-containing protein [bacterium]